MVNAVNKCYIKMVCNIYIYIWNTYFHVDWECWHGHNKDLLQVFVYGSWRFTVLEWRKLVLVVDDVLLRASVGARGILYKPRGSDVIFTMFYIRNSNQCSFRAPWELDQDPCTGCIEPVCVKVPAISNPWPSLVLDIPKFMLKTKSEGGFHCLNP